MIHMGNEQWHVLTERLGLHLHNLLGESRTIYAALLCMAMILIIWLMTKAVCQRHEPHYHGHLRHDVNPPSVVRFPSPRNHGVFSRT